MPVETRAGANNNENADPNINVVVAGAGLDTYIPVIPDAKDANIIAKFKYKTLTKIKGKPTFEPMKEITRQLGRNALAIKVSFGGGKGDALAKCSQGIDTWRIRVYNGMCQNQKAPNQTLRTTPPNRKRSARYLPSWFARRTSKLWRQLGIY